MELDRGSTHQDALWNRCFGDYDGAQLFENCHQNGILVSGLEGPRNVAKRGIDSLYVELILQRNGDTMKRAYESTSSRKVCIKIPRLLDGVGE